MSTKEERFERPGSVRIVKQLLLDFTHNKSSIVLLILTWPIALILVVLAHLKMIWAIGNVYKNASHLVNIGDSSVMDPILALSGSELGKKIRDPQDPLTSEQVVDACFRHIKRVNPYIQAIVALRIKDAREEAILADMAVREGTVPPECSHFWGVPILVKECFEMVGMPYTAGIYGRKGILGTDTCSALVKLQQNEGAIIIGTTNVSEACMYHESSNHVYGCTHNPYDFRRTAGGSSGGCGAAVAACCSPFAVTSDVGGSTRIPALYNGLFGHKPTGGAISNSNTMPLCGTGDIKRYCQLGPTCRYAEDLWSLFKAMVSEGGPVHGLRGDPEDCITLDLSRLEVFVCKRNLISSWFSSEVHPDILTGIDETAAFLASRGATLRYDLEEQRGLADMFAMTNAFQVWGCLMSYHKHKPFAEVIREGLPKVSWWSWQLLTSIFDLSFNTFPAVGLAVLESLFELKILDEENRKFREMGHRLRTTLHKLLAPAYGISVSSEKVCDSEDVGRDVTKGEKHGDDVDVAVGSIGVRTVLTERVILMPSLPTAAPLHGESLLRVLDTANTGFFNIMELPATAVPLGLEKSSRGSRMRMPIGCQIVGGHGRDAITIAIAVELAKAGIARWEPPCDTHDPVGLHY